MARSIKPPAKAGTAEELEIMTKKKKKKKEDFFGFVGLGEWGRVNRA